MKKTIPRLGHRRKVQGLTLVELMIALAISMVLVLAATSMYLATRESQRSVDQASAAHEAAAYTLRTLGRELMNAGFFPAAPEEGECTYCNFRAVCGPEEERRIKRTRKSVRPELKQLNDLRAKP